MANHRIADSCHETKTAPNLKTAKEQGLIRASDSGPPLQKKVPKGTPLPPQKQKKGNPPPAYGKKTELETKKTVNPTPERTRAEFIETPC